MIRFLFTGLLRDRHRSLFPTIVVAIGVMLTVVFHSWLSGVLGDSIEFTAKFSTGHVKVTTASYAENISQMPNDLAIIGSTRLMDTLTDRYPSLDWSERIYFAGLIDVPDKSGETRSQGNALGFGIDLLSGDDMEAERLNVLKSIKKGKAPQKTGEVLLSDSFAEKLKVKPGDTITLIGSTMFGELSFYNFILAGTLEFGTSNLDRGTIIADITDVRQALDMEDAAGEILGFFKTGYFDAEMAASVSEDFNAAFHNSADEFSPLMKSLKEQNKMGVLVDYASMLFGIMIAVFMLAMAIVLWNAGLLGGLRRYGEFGMRLAIGEEKGHVYRTLIYESLLVGVIGSLAGLIPGMAISWYLQNVGIDFGTMMKNANIMMPTIFRARIMPETWIIGFIPGILSTLIGSMLSGIGIYKRQTSQLFKELEA